MWNEKDDVPDSDLGPFEPVYHEFDMLTCYRSAMLNHWSTLLRINS